MGHAPWLAEFDRTISDPLMQFMQSLPGQQLIDRARNRNRDGILYDVQLRSDLPKSPHSWVSLYYGLTRILNVHEHNGEFRLDASDTYTMLRTWGAGWKHWMTRQDFTSRWQAVEAYLDEVEGVVKPQWIGKEGQVHAALCSGSSDAYRVINREASPTFSTNEVKAAVREQLYRPLRETVDSADPGEKWWPSNFRTPASPDILAADVGGRLTIIEAKHHSATKMIAEVPVQAAYYARMFAWLISTDEGALARIEAMLDQRAKLGLTAQGMLHLLRPARVVPVVAIGPKAPGKEARRRFWQVVEVVDAAPSAQVIEPTELWIVDEQGRIREIERAGDVRRA